MSPQLEKIDSGTSHTRNVEHLKISLTTASAPVSPPAANGGYDADLEFHDLPPFPDNIPTAPLLRISLSKLLSGVQDEVDRLWEASCKLGFFYLELRDGEKRNGLESPEQKELWANVWDEHADSDRSAERNHSEGNVAAGASSHEADAQVDGEQLLRDAEALFKVGQQIFELPVEEKSKYDMVSRGSYFGYKGYGKFYTDKEGTKDRNEFYNVSH